MMQAMVILFWSLQHWRPCTAGAGMGREHWLAGKVTHLAAAALRCSPLDCSKVPSVRQPWMVQQHWTAQGRSWQGSRNAAGHRGSQSPVACRWESEGLLRWASVGTLQIPSDPCLRSLQQQRDSPMVFTLRMALKHCLQKLKHRSQRSSDRTGSFAGH